MSLFVNADWSALVPAGSPEAAFGITPKDAKRRGLIPLDEGESLGEPEMLVSANLIGGEEASAQEPEAKEAKAPADKAVRKPSDKGARKPRRK